MNRKLILAVAAASALLLSSCRKADEVTPSESQLDELEFTATIDGPVTKTTVNTNGGDTKNRGKIEWVQGDTITIKDVTKDVSVRYVAAGNGTTATFRKAADQKDKLGSGPYTATYGTAPSTTQNYADHHSEVANQARNVYMEAPESATRSLTFKAACGLLKLTLTAATGESNPTIKQIEVTGTVNGTDATYTLNCVKEDGTAVSISSATDFYLTLPKGEYNRMVFYNKEDKSCEKQCKDEKGMEIKDNIIQPVTISDITFASTSSVLLPGEFSVSAGKKVQFTSGNLWWDGSGFHIESSQTAYPGSWDANYVGHFFWTKIAANSYATSYDDGICATSDVPFFAESKGGLTVDGQGGLYALTKDEWTYLISTRTNASNLCKYGVTVSDGGTDYTNCLIIAPDGYSGTALSSITDWSLSNINSLGLVCLPAAGNRNGSNLLNGGSYGLYWSATPNGSSENYAYDLYFTDSDVYPSGGSRRYYGYSVRLVKKVPEFYPGTELEGIKIGDVTWAPVNCGYDEKYTYGLLYQWGRKYGQDYDVGTITPETLTKDQGEDSANSSKFGKHNTDNWNWFSGDLDNTLWSGSTKGTYDPCPSSWRVPTEAELSALISNKAWGTNTVGGVEQTGYWFNGSSTASAGTGVFLPAAGYRDLSGGNVSLRGSDGYYWSSSVETNHNAKYLNSSNDHATMTASGRANSFSVRCVQE